MKLQGNKALNSYGRRLNDGNTTEKLEQRHGHSADEAYGWDTCSREGENQGSDKELLHYLDDLYLIICTCGIFKMHPVFAAPTDDIADILTQLIDIIGTIFIGVGILLLAYSIGQLVLAFKNEDADSKSRASMQLIVAVCLIAIRPIIDSLDLVDRLV